MIMIDDALPKEMRKEYSDFNFLTLFDAIRPATPVGKRYARMIINRWKKLGAPGE
jgi:hypothetical protein